MYILDENIFPRLIDIQYVKLLKLFFVTGGWDTSCEIAHRWMSVDLTDGESTLV